MREWVRASKEYLCRLAIASQRQARAGTTAARGCPSEGFAPGDRFLWFCDRAEEKGDEVEWYE